MARVYYIAGLVVKGVMSEMRTISENLLKG